MTQHNMDPAFNNKIDIILKKNGYDAQTNEGNVKFAALCYKVRTAAEKARLKPREKKEMIEQLFNTVKSSGGRFVEYNNDGSKLIETSGSTARRIISDRLKPSNLLAEPSRSIVTIRTNVESDRQHRARAAPLLPRSTEVEATSSNTTNNSQDGPASNTRSRHPISPPVVRRIPGIESFVIDGLLNDPSNKHVSNGVYTHFNDLLSNPSKLPTETGKGLNLTVVVGPYDPKNVGINAERGKIYLQQQHGKNKASSGADANNNTIERYIYGRKKGQQSTGITSW